MFTKLSFKQFFLYLYLVVFDESMKPLSGETRGVHRYLDPAPFNLHFVIVQLEAQFSTVVSSKDDVILAGCIEGRELIPLKLWKSHSFGSNGALASHVSC